MATKKSAETSDTTTMPVFKSAYIDAWTGNGSTPVTRCPEEVNGELAGTLHAATLS